MGFSFLTRFLGNKPIVFFFSVIVADRVLPRFLIGPFITLHAGVLVYDVRRMIRRVRHSIVLKSRKELIERRALTRYFIFLRLV